MRSAHMFAVLITALALPACTESERAKNEAKFNDRAAEITCWTHGTEIYTGKSTGKVEYNDDRRISFVDAANKRYTTITGDCRVVYLLQTK